MYVYFYSLHVSENNVSIIRRINCINTTFWYADMDRTAVALYIPDGHLCTVTYTRCRIDKINSPDDGHIAVLNM